MPKLLQINSCVNVASTGRLVEDIGDVVMAAGWESYIAFGRGWRPSSSHLVRVGTTFDVWMHVVKTRLLDRHGFGSYFATQRLVQQVDRIRPDIVQFHNIHGYYANLKVLVNYIAEHGIPLVWSLHDCWSMTGHCAHFALAGCEKWKTGGERCPLLSNYPRSWGWDSSRRNYQQKRALFARIPHLSLISGSMWLADIAKESYFKDRPVHVIANGIDTGVYAPKVNGEALRRQHHLNGKFVIMGCGTGWGASKGLFDYFTLRELLPDEYAIVLVGMRQSLIDTLPAGILGLPQTKTPHELAELYSMADVVLRLSKIESFGLTPVEGFACGTPAIVYNNSSLKELIVPETGFVAENGNVEDVRKKVVRMREIGKGKYTEDCRRIALEKYDRRNCYGEYLKVYWTSLRGGK